MTRREMRDVRRILTAICGDGCWEWGASTWEGYGMAFASVSGSRLAHRVVYEMLVAPLAAETVLHHTCENKVCVNPDHLEPMTQVEHMAAHQATRTHCARGHAWTPENTVIRANGTRQCCACSSMRKRRAKELAA